MKKQTENAVISLLKQNLSREKTPTSNTHSIQKYTPLQTDEVIFIHVEELTFEQESPRREALENILSTLTIDGIQLVYLLIGDEDGVSFYFAVVKNKNHLNELPLDVDDIGRYILKPSIEGNFRGSKITEQSQNKAQILATINGMKRIQRLDGVPTVNTEDGSFQGVDRLVDVMMGDSFVLMVLASPLDETSIKQIETNLYEIHNTLSPQAKESIQESDGTSLTEGTSQSWGESTTSGSNKGVSKSESKSTSTGRTTGTSSGETLGRSDGKTNGTTAGESAGTSKTDTKGTTESGSSSSTSNSGAEGTSYTKNTGTSNSNNTGSSVSKNTGTSKSSNTGTSSSTSTSSNEGTSVSTTKNNSDSTNTSTATNQGCNKSREFTDKLISEWLQYIDEVLLKRLHHGQKRGLFNASAYLLANEQGTLIKLGNTMKALFSGEENNKSPLRLTPVHSANEITNIKNLQLSSINTPLSQAHQQVELLHSKNSAHYASWMSTSELSVMMGLPQKEVVGLALKEEVEFGLNIKKQHLKQENKLLLGHLVHSGGTLNIKVHIDKAHLNKHTFVTGVTGSGKTSTCLRLLDSAQMPFLVIEPAKTEYRILTKTHDDILIFTLGDDRVAPFRLNPFEFFPNENISSRVDMIKANIEAAFDMEAAIPQLIEAALYQCYENYGWDIASSTNSQFEDPFADGVFAFPTLQDLVKQTEVVAEQQGFDERLQKDYIGSIKARLQSLLIGAKGFMLNTPRSIDFRELIEKNVILELDEIKNGNEKSLIMGFVLINLNEAIKQKYKQYKQEGQTFKHITLIEEAHRLLAKHTPGDNPSKKLAVETFSDMLAEVRKYGESLVIVDQIPDKLTPEVLKNTNMKIVHKLFAADDKNAIGNTMALDDEQKQFLSNLETGQAIISNQDFAKPLRVQIKEVPDLSTTTTKLIDEQTIRNNALCYYQQRYKKGLILGLELNDTEPSLEEIEQHLQINILGLAEGWQTLCTTIKEGQYFEFDLKDCLETNRLITPNKMEFVVYYLKQRFYKHKDAVTYNFLAQFIKAILDDDKKSFDRTEKATLRIK